MSLISCYSFLLFLDPTIHLPYSFSASYFASPFIVSSHCQPSLSLYDHLSSYPYCQSKTYQQTISVINSNGPRFVYNTKLINQHSNHLPICNSVINITPASFVPTSTSISPISQSLSTHALIIFTDSSHLSKPKPSFGTLPISFFSLISPNPFVTMPALSY